MDNEETSIIVNIIEILIVWLKNFYYRKKNECLYAEWFQ